MNPLILVTSDVKPIDGYNWHAAIDTYLKALTLTGAMPFILPNLAGGIDLDAALDRVDGVLVTGSRSNVHPSHYSEEPSAAHEPYDEARDATTLPLIRRAIERGVPMLAICRGIQELNVALGGSLITEAQEQPGRMDHRAPVSDHHDERFALAHDVHYEAGAGMAEITGGPTVRVNSLHRQIIGRLADRLVVEAKAEDGTIEAVRVAGAAAFAYGVQWHPEYWAASDKPSNDIFTAFANAARNHGARRTAIAAE
ncbi:MAG TPA: gamma-glutamyl-gamma-aminobutyrate hydrolase family protein [Afifellaceae bacterium]|nr:gamma-glutamyl-gamma-aminobutyrate hydrolase family protein [Afifellaceae bacterium]